MKTNKKLRSIVLSSTILVLLLILISSTSSASITETRITTHGTSDNSAIYGNKIVWMDGRNGGSQDKYGNYVGNWDIYMYDLSTKKEAQITSNEFIQEFPAIYGNRVVWEDERDFETNGLEIRMLDLSTHKEILITAGDIQWPDVFGNLILWMEVHPDWHVNVYDLSTKEETNLVQGSIVYGYAIDGNRIVMADNDNGICDIYMYDLSTKKETQITTSGKAYSPDVYGSKIVWEDNRNGNWDIYMYDLSTKKETQITNHGTAFDPAIYGNNIVWQDNRNGNWDIYAYDLKTHQQIHTTVKSDQVNPAIYDNKIVWTDYRNGKPDIYMGTISYLPVAAFTASPTSGKLPLTVKFTDKSTDVYSYNWNFGDKSTSTVKNPTHKYTKAGKYNVKLTVKNAAGSNTVTKSSYINVAAPVKVPAASFTASPTSGKKPLKVQFTDKSTNSPTSWKWSFGDGTYSTSKNPAHTYSKSGKYTISLTVKNSKGSATKTASGYITVK